MPPTKLVAVTTTHHGSLPSGLPPLVGRVNITNLPETIYGCVDQPDCGCVHTTQTRGEPPIPPERLPKAHETRVQDESRAKDGDVADRGAGGGAQAAGAENGEGPKIDGNCEENVSVDAEAEAKDYVQLKFGPG